MYNREVENPRCWKITRPVNVNYLENVFIPILGSLMMITWRHALSKMISNITVCTNKAIYEISKNGKTGRS